MEQNGVMAQQENCNPRPLPESKGDIHNSASHKRRRMEKSRNGSAGLLPAQTIPWVPGMHSQGDDSFQNILSAGMCPGGSGRP